jgi:O-antigen/teichoic acid export membrane protein
MAAVGVATVAAIVVALPIRQWLHLDLLSDWAVLSVIVMLAIYVGIDLQTSLTEAAFRAVGMFPRGIRLAAILRAADLAGAGSAALLSHDVVVTAGALAGTRLLGQSINHWILVNTSPVFADGRGTLSFRRLRPLLRPSLASMTLPLGYAVATQGMVLLVGASMGPASVVLLNTVRIAATLVRHTAGVVIYGIQAELTMALASRDLQRSRQLHVRGTSASLIASVLVASALIAFGRPLISLWTRAAVHPSLTFLALMVLTTLADVPWQSSSIVLIGQNRHGRLAALYLASCAVAVGAAAATLPLFGIEAVPLALFVVDLLVTAYAVSRALADTGQSWPSFCNDLIAAPRQLLRLLPSYNART